jgi:hypothetical protein
MRVFYQIFFSVYQILSSSPVTDSSYLSLLSLHVMLRCLTRARPLLSLLTPRSLIHIHNKTMTTDHSHGHARVPNTLEWLAKTKRGDYLVQVAWPLCWGEDRVASENEVVNLV